MDLESKAIIVNYEVEATVLGENGQPMLCEKKNNQKRYFSFVYIAFLYFFIEVGVSYKIIHYLTRINITRLSMSSNLPQLAQEIVEKCKFIHPSKVMLVEQLLEVIRDRQEDEERRAPGKILNK